MQTGTVNNSYHKTLVLLYLGYFIDFYDLTIFSANYNGIIHDLFHIYNQITVQQIYLSITNFYTLGIIMGGLVFGVIGDKYGRGFAIKHSIFLYSAAIFLSIFTHSIYLFTLLRFIAGFGLATEFATSSVLISELFNHNNCSRTSIAKLYACGIGGGMTATFIGIFSWQIMFLFGSITGFILYLLRKTFIESQEFLNLAMHTTKGKLVDLVNNKIKIFQFIMLLCIIIPFYFLISAMFIFPNFMTLKHTLSKSTTILLMCFFSGNLSSVICYTWLLNANILQKKYLLIFNTLIFAIIASIYCYVMANTFIPYFFIIGFICGGLPTLWIEIVIKNYPTHIRNTATNLLYVGGRASGILFNFIQGILLSNNSQTYVHVNLVLVLIISALSLFSILFIEKKHLIAFLK